MRDARSPGPSDPQWPRGARSVEQGRPRLRRRPGPVADGSAAGDTTGAAAAGDTAAGDTAAGAGASTVGADSASSLPRVGSVVGSAVESLVTSPPAGATNCAVSASAARRAVSVAPRRPLWRRPPDRYRCRSPRPSCCRWPRRMAARSRRTRGPCRPVSCSSASRGGALLVASPRFWYGTRVSVPGRRRRRRRRRRRPRHCARPPAAWSSRPGSSGGPPSSADQPSGPPARWSGSPLRWR